jgi:hypothetical protein
VVPLALPGAGDAADPGRVVALDVDLDLRVLDSPSLIAVEGRQDLQERAGDLLGVGDGYREDADTGPAAVAGTTPMRGGGDLRVVVQDLVQAVHRVGQLVVGGRDVGDADGVEIEIDPDLDPDVIVAGRLVVAGLLQPAGPATQDVILDRVVDHVGRDSFQAGEVDHGGMRVVVVADQGAAQRRGRDDRVRPLVDVTLGDADLERTAVDLDAGQVPRHERRIDGRPWAGRCVTLPSGLRCRGHG